jgi:hypothetical protein
MKTRLKEVSEKSDDGNVMGITFPLRTESRIPWSTWAVVGKRSFGRHLPSPVFWEPIEVEMHHFVLGVDTEPFVAPEAALQPPQQADPLGFVRSIG